MTELREAVDRSERLSTLGLMAGMVAHEFNNLLTPIMTYAELALSRPEDERLREKALQRAAANAARGARVASSVLALAGDPRYGGGDQELRRTDVGEALLRDAAACLPGEPGKEGIEVRIEVDGVCPAAIAPTAMHQILMNMVLNARKAMLPGGGVLTLRSRREGEVVVVEVEDTGRGMDRDTVERLFRPFERGEDEWRFAAGSGLGLAICRHLVEGCGGRIDVRSAPSSGTCFSVRVPLAADRDAAEAA